MNTKTKTKTKSAKTSTLRGLIIMALKDITAKDTKFGSKVIESPAINDLAQEEVDNFAESAKLRELAERIASKKNIPVVDAIYVILEKLGEKAIDKADELKKELKRKKKSAAAKVEKVVKHF